MAPKLPRTESAATTPPKPTAAQAAVGKRVQHVIAARKAAGHKPQQPSSEEQLAAAIKAEEEQNAEMMPQKDVSASAETKTETTEERIARLKDLKRGDSTANHDVTGKQSMTSRAREGLASACQRLASALGCRPKIVDTPRIHSERLAERATSQSSDHQR